MNVGTLAAGQLIDVVLLGGFSLLQTSPTGTLPDYFKLESPFLGKLNNIGVGPSSVKVVPVYEQSWLDFNQFLFMKSEVEKVIKALRKIRDNQPGKDFFPVAYSGGGHALLSALSADRPEAQDGFGVKTAILVGAPIPRPSVHKGPLERIINIYGSEDMFFKGDVPGAPPIPQRFTHDQHPLETINIKLMGVKHNDQDSYFYTSAEHPSQLQINASNFIARLAKASRNMDDMRDFLFEFGNPDPVLFIDPQTGISHQIKTYVIDTANIAAKVDIQP